MRTEWDIYIPNLGTATNSSYIAKPDFFVFNQNKYLYRHCNHLKMLMRFE